MDPGDSFQRPRFLPSPPFISHPASFPLTTRTLLTLPPLLHPLPACHWSLPPLGHSHGDHHLYLFTSAYLPPSCRKSEYVVNSRAVHRFSRVSVVGSHIYSTIVYKNGRDRPGRGGDDAGEAEIRAPVAGGAAAHAADDEHDGVRGAGRAGGRGGGGGGRGAAAAAGARGGGGGSSRGGGSGRAGGGGPLRVGHRRRGGGRARGLASGVPRPRGAGAGGAPAELGRLLGRRDRRVPPRLRALQPPPRTRTRHLHVQGRHGVLQPRMPAAAHHDRGVEGEVRARHAAADGAGVRPGGDATAQRRGLRRQTRHGRHGLLRGGD